MKQSIPIAIAMMGALLGGGCATKKYVQQTVNPVSGKVDQVAQQANSQGQKIDQTSQSLDQVRQAQQNDETELSANKERAMSADSRAGDAINRADEASRKADKLSGDLAELNNTVANLDDYKQVGQTTVNFGFDSDKLSSDAKGQLDEMVAGQNRYKRYFIAVEGFTDAIGGADYNAALSRRRADAVVEYLVAQHNVPIYRVHMVGLGKEKPIDEARTRAARAKNRRVEVSLFSADPGVVAMNGGAESSGGAAQPGDGAVRTDDQANRQ